MGKVGAAIGLTLASIMLAGGVALSIPESKNWILDNIAKHSTVYKTQLDENKALKSELKKKIADFENKQQELETIKISLAEKESKIIVLTEEKEMLLNSLTEIDNRINNTTDQTTIDNLNTKKTFILNQIESLETTIITLTAEKEALSTRVAELETQVATLDKEKQELENQLAQYKSCTLNIDDVDSISSIVIEDTKLNQSFTMTNLNSITFELQKWQNATITYNKPADANVYAIVNNVKQATNIAVVVGSEHAGAIVQVSSCVEEIEQAMSASLFSFSNNVLTGYNGEDTDVVIPSTYSLGDVIEQTYNYADSMELEMFLMENENNAYPLTVTLTSGETAQINNFDDYYNYSEDISYPITIKKTIQTYVDGTDFTVTEIGERAFENKNVQSIILPATVTKINSAAFINCMSLSNINLKNCVELGSGVFTNCRALNNIVLPDTLTTIGSSTFSGCWGLTSIGISKNVSSIDSKAFSNCKNLNEFVVDENNNNYCSVDGVLYNNDKTTLVLYPNARSGKFVIPEGVKTIGDNAFYQTLLTEVEMSDNITVINEKAFYDSETLSVVKLSKNITEIGLSAFAYCSITSIELPNSLTALSKQAFLGCSKLTTIILHPSLTTIGQGAFRNCTALANVYFTGTEQEWQAITISAENTTLTNATITYNYVQE